MNSLVAVTCATGELGTGGIAYSKGNCVVCDGATWIALSDVEAGAKPGSALEWRLVVKSEGRP